MIHVGLAEIRFATEPESLKTIGLGSCVGVVVYQEELCIAGMAHVMLPDSTLARTASFLPGKFADTAVSWLVSEMREKHGIRSELLKSKIAGGAEMFRSSRSGELESIGCRNVKAVKAQLISHHIPLVAEQTGEDFGRTIEFFTTDSRLVIRSIHSKEIVI